VRRFSVSPCNRISTTDPNTTVVVCAYDKDNRLTSQTNTLATNVVGTTSLTFGYDGLGRLTLADSSDGGAYTTNIDRTWNTLGMLESETQVLDGYNSGNGRTIGYVYDVEGNIAGKVYPVSGDSIDYTRDALDRVDKVSCRGAEVADYTWSGPRMIKKAYPGSYATYLTDGYGRLTDIHAFDTSSGHTLAEFTYTFDNSSQIIGEDTVYYDDVQNTRMTGHHLEEGDQYKYDGARRLVSVLRGVATAYITDSFAQNLSLTRYRNWGAFNYDQTGNRTTRRLDGSDDQTFKHDKANQISTEGGVAVTHDKNGNYTGASNALRYAWNNQWGQYIVAGSPAVTNVWRYDALGRKVQWGNGTRTNRYYYDGDQIVEHCDLTGGVETQRKQYVWGDRIDDLLYYNFYVPTPDEDYFVHTDHLGSVQLLCDSSGAIGESCRYWEWGQTTIVDSSFAKLTLLESAATKNNVHYTGRDQYTVIGTVDDTWYHNRARANRTAWGRFVERDPDSYGDGENLYAYVGSAPIGATDPTGTIGIPLLPPVGPGGVVTYNPGFTLRSGTGSPAVDTGFGPGFGGKFTVPGDAGGIVALIFVKCAKLPPCQLCSCALPRNPVTSALIPPTAFSIPAAAYNCTFSHVGQPDKLPCSQQSSRTCPDGCSGEVLLWTMICNPAPGFPAFPPQPVTCTTLCPTCP